MKSSEPRYVTLERSYTPWGTLGKLVTPNAPVLRTLERPWLLNEKNVSCIPEGVYTCKRVESPRFGSTFEVCDVENRTHILFHALNEITETQGCIGVGERLLIRKNEYFLSNSRKGLNLFLAAFDGVDEFKLIVRAYTARVR